MKLDKPIFSSNLAGLFLRVPVGIYFFLSGRLFLHQPDSLVQVIKEFQIFPDSLAQLYALGLPYLLIGVGVLLTFGFLTTLASIIGLVIIASYIYVFGIYPDAIVPFNQYIIWFGCILGLLSTGPGALSVDKFRTVRD